MCIKTIRDLLVGHGVRRDEAPIGTPAAIGRLERYHAPLKLAYKRIWTDTRSPTSDRNCLHLVVSAIQYTVGPEELCADLLVSDAVLQPA